MRYKPKTRCSKHAQFRIKQRYGEEDVEILCKHAKRYGICSSQLEEGSPLENYARLKELKKNKMVRLYNGFLFLFSKNGRLITTYPIPEEHMAEYEAKKGIEEKNRKEYKRKRSSQSEQKKI